MFWPRQAFFEHWLYGVLILILVHCQFLVLINMTFLVLIYSLLLLMRREPNSMIRMTDYDGDCLHVECQFHWFNLLFVFQDQEEQHWTLDYHCEKNTSEWISMDGKLSFIWWIWYLINAPFQLGRRRSIHKWNNNHLIPRSRRRTWDLFHQVVILQEEELEYQAQMRS